MVQMAIRIRPSNAEVYLDIDRLRRKIKREMGRRCDWAKRRRGRGEGAIGRNGEW